MSLIISEYGDDTRTLKAVDETGTTNQNILDLITLSNENASSELESLFEGNIDFNTPVNDLPVFFRALVIELQIAYFWVLSNNTEEAKTHRETVREKAQLILEKKFKPSITVS